MKTTVKVDGMSCNHCCERLKKVLLAADGVLGASVSLEKKCVEIEYDENKTDETALRGSVEDAGFVAVK
ncbi:MAG: heavy-metal-associated domain-containing protein [Oscillospiraceae bacterium]